MLVCPPRIEMACGAFSRVAQRCQGCGSTGRAWHHNHIHQHCAATCAYYASQICIDQRTLHTSDPLAVLDPTILPLRAVWGVCSRPQVYSTPLVGVWVKGPSSVLHPLAAAACLRFACSSLLMDRAVNPEDGSFILLLCPEGEAGEGGCKTVEPCSIGLGMSALRKLVMACAGFKCWHSMQLHNMHAPCRQCASCAS